MYGKRGRIGLIVLDSDLCIEADLRRVLPDGVEIHAARVRYPHEVTAAAMEEATSHLGEAVQSLLPIAPKAVVWACTSGSFMTGRAGNEALLAQLAASAQNVPVATASSAVVAALKALRVKRPAVGTPYAPPVNAALERFLREHGLDPLPVTGYFEDLVDDFKLQSIEPEDVARFARRIDRSEADAILLSCTGMPTSSIVRALEDELGKPVISSNLAILWFASEIGGIGARSPDLGRLSSVHAAEGM
jgi:maleate cis-trans isomerase